MPDGSKGSEVGKALGTALERVEKVCENAGAGELEGLQGWIETLWSTSGSLLAVLPQKAEEVVAKLHTCGSLGALVLVLFHVFLQSVSDKYSLSFLLLGI